ncbi:MAG: hypothetical protein VXY00_03105 [Candidatus Latescibacterota bacterium]|nr:hypothetical protein [Candidatus Latescibacterota bacterium]
MDEIGPSIGTIAVALACNRRGHQRRLGAKEPIEHGGKEPSVLVGALNE